MTIYTALPEPLDTLYFAALDSLQTVSNMARDKWGDDDPDYDREVYLPILT